MERNMSEEKKATKGEKEALLEVLRAKRDAKRANRIRDHWEKLYPIQREFIASTENLEVLEAAFRTGNQQGKSWTAAYMASVFATGEYPDGWDGRRYPGPTRGWIATESTTLSRDVAQKYLLGEEQGFLSPDKVQRIIMGHGAGQSIDQLHIKHLSGGTSIIGFKSYDQDRTKLQGDTLHYVWCDEEAPPEHYMELLARVIKNAGRGGLVYSTFTPLHGANRILGRFTERTIEAMRTRRMTHGRADDALHLKDPKVREALFALFPAHERRARIDGLPSLGSGAVFEDVQWEDIVSPFTFRNGELIHETEGVYDTRAAGWIWGIDFGIGHPFAAVLCAWDRDGDVIHIVATVKISGSDAANHAMRMLAVSRSLGEVKVAWPHDGAAREKGSGEQLAAIYKRNGLAMLPTHATHAKTGGFSTEAGIADMLLRFRQGRLKVAKNLYEWKAEFEGYHRKDGLIVKENDDLMSASRIACMQIRSAKEPQGAYRGVPVFGYSGNNGGTKPFADGLNDWDLFTGEPK
jgi:phage terminase large subunit-like protein